MHYNRSRGVLNNILRQRSRVPLMFAGLPNPPVILTMENVKNLHDVWGMPETFQRHYTEDYNLISGTKNKADQTCWNNKYSTSIYGKENHNNLELHPIPDFVSWQQSGELHYLSSK